MKEGEDTMSTIQKYKIKVDNKNFSVNLERYSSAQDMVADCKTRHNTSTSFHDYTTHSVSKDWEGVDSYQEALDLLSGGYQPTVDKLSASLKVNRTGVTKRIVFENNVHGFAPVVPLAMMSIPNSMINMTMKPIKCKVIDVYYDMTVSSGTSTEQIIQNGQKLLSVIIDLEKSGYRFNLYAVQGYCDDSSADMVCIKVKSSDKPIDIKRISFPLTHPAFFRVIGFDWYGKCPVAKYRSGYGRALTYCVKDHRSFAKQVFGDNAVYFSGNNLKYEEEKHLKEVLSNDNSKEG